MSNGKTILARIELKHYDAERLNKVVTTYKSTFNDRARVIKLTKDPTKKYLNIALMLRR